MICNELNWWIAHWPRQETINNSKRHFWSSEWLPDCALVMFAPHSNSRSSFCMFINLEPDPKHDQLNRNPNAQRNSRSRLLFFPWQSLYSKWTEWNKLGNPWKGGECVHPSDHVSRLDASQLCRSNWVAHHVTGIKIFGESDRKSRQSIFPISLPYLDHVRCYRSKTLQRKPFGQLKGRDRSKLFRNVMIDRWSMNPSWFVRLAEINGLLLIRLSQLCSNWRGREGWNHGQNPRM